MINLDWTFLVQWGIFIFLIIFLSKVLFKPVLSVLEAREEMAEGPNQRAKELKEEVASLKQEITEAISKAKAGADEIRNEAISSVRAKESELLSSSREETNQYLKEARTQIADQVGKAAQELRKDGDRIGSALAKKLMPSTGQGGKA